jgi:hypothetical protein
VDRCQRDLELVAETLGMFVQLWLAHTPQLPDEAKAPARSSAHARFHQFVTHLSERFSGGPRFLDDLPPFCLYVEACTEGRESNIHQRRCRRRICVVARGRVARGNTIPPGLGHS